MKKSVPIIIAALVIFFVFQVSGCAEKDNPGGGQSSRPAPAVRVAVAEQGNISDTLQLTGSVVATEIARMGSPAEGPVINSQMREGDRVEKDQVLLSIGRSSAVDAMVETAKHTLAVEQEELGRITRLVESGAIPAEQLDLANLKVFRAKADISKALESRGDYQIAAPWDGVVRKVFVADGDFVSPRQHLLEIYDPSKLVVQFSVPESRSVSVHRGMEVQVLLDAYPGRKFNAVITRVHAELNSATRTRKVEATIIDNDLELLPGMFARIELALETVDQTILIPERAVVLAPDQSLRVYVVNGDQEIETRNVQLGIEQGSIVQILSGISAGEKIVTHGNDGLRDGVSVRILTN